MTTPDFEDWLGRQEVPIEDTTTIDKWIKYLEIEELAKGSLEVAARVYEDKYEILPKLGIRPIERHYTYMGEPFVETRYAIKGYPGLWGKPHMYEIAIEKAYTAGMIDIARTLSARAEE